ncbi:hypothetical protein HRbin41_00030 [bacterium HR41]|nr:hypothetical protein HRbin41_00030 [bacterium HR41]
MSGGVAEDDTTGALERVEHVGRRPVAPALMLDGNPQPRAGIGAARERRGGRRDLDLDFATDEAQAAVRKQRTGQEAAFAQHLEPVADAEHRAAGGGEAAHRAHHRREPGERPGAQIVAVREAARDHNAVETGEVAFAVVDEVRLAEARACQQRVAVVTGAGEAHDSETH